MKWRSLTKWCFLALFLFAQPHAYADVDVGYEAANNVPGTCPDHKNETDVWGFAACNCTSYVAYRLRLNDVRRNGLLFTNTSWGVQWSDAWKWGDDAKLQTVGVRKDQYPAVGSIAYWSTAKIRGTGHVAYVQHLFTHPDDGRIVGIGIMEYNDVSFRYTYRWLGHGRGEYPSSFLHFEEKGRDADTTNVTCVSGLSASPPGSHAGSFCWKHNGSDAKCEHASSYSYFDYRSCQKYTVTQQTNPSASSYCSHVGTNPGYTVHLGNWFPEPIDPTVKGTDFATCDSAGSTSKGNSRVVSGRFPDKRRQFLLRTILE